MCLLCETRFMEPEMAQKFNARERTVFLEPMHSTEEVKPLVKEDDQDWYTHPLFI